MGQKLIVRPIFRNPARNSYAGIALRRFDGIGAAEHDSVP
jgi:hypothetical protein